MKNQLEVQPVAGQLRISDEGTAIDGDYGLDEKVNGAQRDFFSIASCGNLLSVLRKLSV